MEGMKREMKNGAQAYRLPFLFHWLWGKSCEVIALNVLEKIMLFNARSCRFTEKEEVPAGVTIIVLITVILPGRTPSLMALR